VNTDLDRKPPGAFASPLMFVFAAAFLWSTGGLFIKWNSLSGLELAGYRSFFALITVALLTRREGFGLNRLTGAAAILYAVLVILFVMATKETTAANAIFLQYTAPVYLLILEPIVYKEKFRKRDLITVLVCIGAMALFFVGQLRPQDVAGNLMALLSGFFFRALFSLTATSASARSESRFVSDLWKPVGRSDLRAVGTDRAFARHASRLAGRNVSRRSSAWCFVRVVYGRNDAWCEVVDAGIVCYIEPVLNPVWVFLVLGERPSRWALIGGAIIITAVIIHMLLDARYKRLPPLESAHG
jgi:drug/metabolite transporter (DMT)-like permease